MAKENKSNNKLIVYSLVLIISTFWGFSFLATSILVKYLEPVQVLAARWLVAGIIYLVMILCGKIKLDLSKRNRIFLLICALLEPCAYMLFENTGVKYTSASVASIMIAIIPCVVLMLNTIIYRHRTSKRGIFSILLAFAGVAMCTMLSPAFSLSGDLRGYFFMIGAVIAGAFFAIFSAKAGEEYSSLEITASMAIIGAIFFNVLNIAGGYGLSTFRIVLGDWHLLAGILFLGVCCSAICFLAFNKTIAMMDPALANNMNASMTTIVGALAGIFIGGDPGGLYTVVGLAMTLAGVVLSSREIN